MIADVHAFPGHIACDSESNSEAVVPMIVDGKCVGVLDIDCKTRGAFGKQGANDEGPENQIGLEEFVKVVLEAVGEKGWWTAQQ